MQLGSPDRAFSKGPPRLPLHRLLCARTSSLSSRVAATVSQPRPAESRHVSNASVIFSTAFMMATSSSSPCRPSSMSSFKLLNFQHTTSNFCADSEARHSRHARTTTMPRARNITLLVVQAVEVSAHHINYCTLVQVAEFRHTMAIICVHWFDRRC